MPRAERHRPRLTDRLEDVASWVLMSAGLLLLVGAWMSGLAVHSQLAELAVTEGATRTEIDAVLVEAVPASSGRPTSSGVPTRASAHWFGVDGSPHTGSVPVMSAAAAGSTVPIWVDGSGTITTPPSSGADAWAGGMLIGFNVLLMGAAVLYGIRIGVRRLTACANAARWEREWAQVGPEWSG